MNTTTCPHCNTTINYKLEDAVVVCPECKTIVGGEVYELDDLASEEEILRYLQKWIPGNPKDIKFKKLYRTYLTMRIRGKYVGYTGVIAQNGTKTNIHNTSFSTNRLITEAGFLGYNNTEMWPKMMTVAPKVTRLGQFSPYTYDISHIDWDNDTPKDEPTSWQIPQANKDYLKICGHEPTRPVEYSSMVGTVMIPIFFGEVTYDNETKSLEFSGSATPVLGVLDIINGSVPIMKTFDSPLGVTKQYLVDHVLTPTIPQILIELLLVPGCLFFIFGILRYLFNLPETPISVMCLISILMYAGYLIFWHPHTSGAGRSINCTYGIKKSILIIPQKLYAKAMCGYYIIKDAQSTPTYFYYDSLESQYTQIKKFYDEYTAEKKNYYLVPKIVLGLVVLCWLCIALPCWG